jgi:hypothetical protein
MDFIDRIVEQRIAEAIERGELGPGPLNGKPIPDLDQPRPAGWWAERFVRRERSRVVREQAVDEIGAWRLRFWRAPDVGQLHRLVADANHWLDAVNQRVVDEDVIPRFDPADVERTWRSLDRSRAR